jgi:SAM-dependent methyltransferase
MSATDPIPQSDRAAGSPADAVRDHVRRAYGRIGSGEIVGCCGLAPEAPHAACCAGGAPAELATSIGYSAAELAALPAGANLGLSCGNPTAVAALAPGEVVVDLGSGGGFDVFLAGPRVGPTGRAIGVDMTAEMVSRARANAAAYRERTGLDNVEFRLGEIEHLPLADASADAVISNCVLNLSPDKAQVWREIARVLRPGGRVAVSDLALRRPLPAAVRDSVEALVGCVAGAVPVDEHRALAEAAGLVEVTVTPKAEYVAALAAFEDPLYREIAAQLPAGTTAADYLTSLEVTARKPTP